MQSSTSDNINANDRQRHSKDPRTTTASFLKQRSLSEPTMTQDTASTKQWNGPNKSTVLNPAVTNAGKLSVQPLSYQDSGTDTPISKDISTVTTEYTIENELIQSLQNDDTSVNGTAALQVENGGHDDWFPVATGGGVSGTSLTLLKLDNGLKHQDDHSTGVQQVNYTV